MNYLYETSTEKNHKNFPCCMTNGKKRLIFSTCFITIEKKYQKLHKNKKPVIKFYLITEIVFFSCKVLFDYSKPPQKTRIKPHETAFLTLTTSNKKKRAFSPLGVCLDYFFLIPSHSPVLSS